MNISGEVGKLAAALVAFQAAVPKIDKTKTAEIPTRGGGKYSYSYADLSDVVEAVRPVLAEHGLAVFQNLEWDGDHDLLRTTILHTSGQVGTSAVRLPVAQATAQEWGSWITYFRRYAYCAALGLVPDDDDDGKAASSRQAKRSQPVPRHEPTAPPKPPLTREEIDRLKQEAMAKITASSATA